MRLGELAQRLDLKIETAGEHVDTEVSGGYASDLLSCVMAKAQPDNVWITLQSHPNVVAVANVSVSSTLLALPGPLLATVMV